MGVAGGPKGRKAGGDRMIDKLKSSLVGRLARANESELVDIVLELRPQAASSPEPETGSRSDRVAARKEAFVRIAAPVEEAIRQAGGEVTGSAWINQTVRARVPARGVKDLCAHEEVRAVDAPRLLRPESG